MMGANAEGGGELYDLEGNGEELIAAAGEGDLEALESLLVTTPGPTICRDVLNYYDSDHWTALHMAANNGCEEALTMLLKHAKEVGANLDPRTRHQETPLHRACLFGHTSCVRIILESTGLQKLQHLVLATNRFKETPLHCAAHGGSWEICEQLCRVVGKGSNTVLAARSDGGGAPLHYAVAEGHVMTYKKLLELKADPEAVDYQGRRPLDLRPSGFELSEVDLTNSTTTQLSKLDLVTNCENMVDALIKLANMRKAEHDADGACKAFSKALSLCRDVEEDDKPEHSTLTNPGMKANMSSTEYQDQRIKEYRQFPYADDSKLQQTAADCFAGLGHCHLKLQETDLSIAACKAALELKPNDISCLYNLGSAYLQKDDLEQAQRFLRLALAIEPDNPKIQQQMVRTSHYRRKAAAQEADMAKKMIQGGYRSDIEIDAGQSAQENPNCTARALSTDATENSKPLDTVSHEGAHSVKHCHEESNCKSIEMHHSPLLCSLSALD